MAYSLSARLAAVRDRLFVGRAPALALFASALADGDPPFSILFVHGPGGVGKTALLHAFASQARRAGVPVVHLDGRDVAASPASFVAAVTAAGAAGEALLGGGPGRCVLLVDTYEQLTALDGWLRDRWLPEVSADAVIVLASRDPPATAWRVDPGWQALVNALELDDLTPEESAGYLELRRVPADRRADLVALTHGHPLALSLVADLWAQRPGTVVPTAMDPDVVRALLERFVEEVPGPDHRSALEVCALLRLTTEALLEELLAQPHAHHLFEWLRGLSFVQAGARGLFPHDLARDALLADLRWRNPDWYRELHRRARAYYARRLPALGVREQQLLLFDYAYLHRDHPIVRPFFAWRETPATLADPPESGDVAELLAMVARHEGEASRRLAEGWLSRQAEHVAVIRDADRRPAGFVAAVDLAAAAPEELAADPATARASAHLARTAPLRVGERALYFRHWMSRDHYQDVSAVQSAAFVRIAQCYLTTPGLAFSFLCCADGEFWQPAMRYGDLHRLPEADFAVGGRRYAVFGHDWRAVPPLRWLSLLAEREVAHDEPVVADALSAFEVLDSNTFAGAVRNALRYATAPDALQANPLLRTRLVAGAAGTGAGPGQRAEALQRLLRETAETLQANPREHKWYRALYHTYLHPAPTQERAAELLDVPFSSYRRHLKAGIERVTAVLWEREVRGGGFVADGVSAIEQRGQASP